MASPNIASVTIGDASFRAVGVHFGVSTVHDGVTGMPMIGSVACDIIVLVDVNDRINVPFATLKNLFELATAVNRSKILPIKLSFWADDAAQDAICTYSFRGWLSSYVTSTGASRGGEHGGANHLLTLTLQPELDEKQHTKIDIGN
ncbi:hypothetical protein [Terriglobus sp.]|uniref:hypothetical protein n=1 Tax=Terriglobus sp. TaxID=1889013 RepID=UPI003B0070BF